MPATSAWAAWSASPRRRASIRRASRSASRARTARIAGAATPPALAVHCVPADAPELAELFGGETADEVDKFARCAWHDGPEGLPILDRCERWFVGRVIDRVDGGDHELFLLEPVAASAGREEDFTFHRAKRIEPGHPA